jgi:peroxiredoxin
MHEHGIGINIHTEIFEPIPIMINNPNLPIHEETGVMIGTLAVCGRKARGIVILDESGKWVLDMRQILRR